MRLEVNVRQLPSGESYILLDEIDETHRERLCFFAALNDALFTVGEREACLLSVVVEYSQGGIVS